MKAFQNPRLLYNWGKGSCSHGCGVLSGPLEEDPGRKAQGTGAIHQGLPLSYALSNTPQHPPPQGPLQDFMLCFRTYLCIVLSL